MQLGFGIGALRGDVEAHQRLAGAGHAGDKTDRLAALLAGLRDDLANKARGLAAVGRIAARDVGHVVPGIERHRRLDDGGRGLVATAHKVSGVQRIGRNRFGTAASMAA